MSDLNERIDASILRLRKVLNRLDPHLGCVNCRGPLVDGRCPQCDPTPTEAES